MKNEPIYNLLNSINSPDDLRRLEVDQLPEVCDELRQDIIKELSCNPGHFAASLGTVELTVALHYVYNTPYDRIVWDVGHQAYGHKILTGRREAFSTNRKLGGIRPFPSPEESEYDTFTCGHASNSISAALGMAVAAAKKGDDQRHVIAIIGDGSMSGGLAFEGLNNSSTTPNNLLIILNDNDMAIDRSVGGMKQYLFNLTTSNRYNQLRFKASRLLFKLGILNDERRKALIRFGNSLKSMAAQQQNIFEGMNIRYFGPIDGHDIKNLSRVLRDIKDLKGPKILHLHTIKGKGFAPAEKHATEWHAPGKFDPVTGERFVANTEGMPPLFQDVFGNTLVELAEANPRIVGVTPAMPSGCSMNILMSKMPKRAFDVGIAEGHAVTFSGGILQIHAGHGNNHHVVRNGDGLYSAVGLQVVLHEVEHFLSVHRNERAGILLLHPFSGIGAILLFDLWVFLHGALHFGILGMHGVVSTFCGTLARKLVKYAEFHDEHHKHDNDRRADRKRHDALGVRLALCKVDGSFGGVFYRLFGAVPHAEFKLHSNASLLLQRAADRFDVKPRRFQCVVLRKQLLGVMYVQIRHTADGRADLIYRHTAAAKINSPERALAVIVIIEVDGLHDFDRHAVEKLGAHVFGKHVVVIGQNVCVCHVNIHAAHIGNRLLKVAQAEVAGALRGEIAVL